jgi:excisionase family DNA binding protein
MTRRTTFPSSQLVTAKVASIETGIPYTTLRDLTFRGEIPVVKVGRAWYFARRDLENWIATHKERLL